MGFKSWLFENKYEEKPPPIDYGDSQAMLKDVLAASAKLHDPTRATAREELRRLIKKGSGEVLPREIAVVADRFEGWVVRGSLKDNKTGQPRTVTILNIGDFSLPASYGNLAGQDEAQAVWQKITNRLQKTEGDYLSGVQVGILVILFEKSGSSFNVSGRVITKNHLSFCRTFCSFDGALQYAEKRVSRERLFCSLGKPFGRDPLDLGRMPTGIARFTGKLVSSCTIPVYGGKSKRERVAEIRLRTILSNCGGTLGRYETWRLIDDTNATRVGEYDSMRSALKGHEYHKTMTVQMLRATRSATIGIPLERH